jgi:protein-disulfide isomerase
MRRARRLGGAAALLLLAGAFVPGESGAAPPGGEAARIDWRTRVAATPEGGFRMGNPDAPVKLVQYTSLTCPHCARFEEEGGAALRDRYVAGGRVSWEVRTFLLFPTDPSVSLLLHCGGAADFFPAATALYAAQPEWTGRLQALPRNRLLEMQELPVEQSAAAIAAAAGLDAFFRGRGMPEAKLRACLSDPAGLARLADLTRLGVEEGVTGTPTFLINGELAEDAYDWESLEPRLKAATG